MKEIIGRYQDGMKHADTHVHTIGSDGLLTGQNLVEMAMHHPFQFDAVVITDHETITEAARAKEYALQKGYPLEVVVGEEVSTREGHIVALYIESPIPRGLPVEDTIRLIHRAGGLVIVVHPFFSIIPSVGEQTLSAIMHNPDPEISIDGFEVLNFGVTNRKRSHANEKAQDFYEANAARLGAAIAATDAHFSVIGGGVTAYTGATLREGIQAKTTVALGVEDSERQMLRRFAVRFFGEEEVFHPTRRTQARRIARWRGENL